jgi:uncharacterized protein (TIGR02996 family)
MSAALTDEDKAFLRAILDRPEELATWLVYADWLDERDDSGAEFIRLQLRLTELREAEERARLESRVAELARGLNPVWVAMVDRTQIENCRGPFQFRCPLTWQELTPTRDENVRFCETCREEVIYCRSLSEARQFAGVGNCVALSKAVLRSPGDLQPEPFPPEDVVFGLLEENEEHTEETDDPDLGEES